MGRKALSPEDPQRLGEYWLAARLGSGGQGVVFEAYDASGTQVAVKVLRRDFSSSEASRLRFAREVTAAQRVASFCTARVLAADMDANSPYIVSEFVAGTDLGTSVRERGPLAGGDLVRLSTGVVTALAAIHQAGVVHRDLKPGNVLLGPDGPRVIDFGVARTSEMTLTESGAVMGTFGYIAPEILQGERAAEAADIFAWGALVLFAATGSEPFRGDHIGEVILRTIEYEPDLSVLPDQLQSLVGQALARNPRERPSAADLLLRLIGSGLDGRRALQAGASVAAGMLAHHETAPVPALGDVAEAAYKALSPPEQAAAREIWLRLVTPGSAPDGSFDTVRAADDEELLHGRSEEEQVAVQRAISAFCEEGVLLREGVTVRPVNAAVLRAWPRLRGWVDIDREVLRIQRKLGEAARVWQRHGCRFDDLERGTALQDAVTWAASAPTHLRHTRLETRFLQASQKAEARRVRRIRRLNIFLVGALVMALIFAEVALLQRQSALSQRQAAVAAQKQALSRQLAAQSVALIGTNPDLASLLAVSAYRTSPTTEAITSLEAAADLPLIRRITGHDDAVFDVVFSPGGRTLATAGNDGTVRLWDPGTGRSRKTITSQDESVSAVAFSPDGKTLAVAGDGGTVRLLDPVTGHSRKTISSHSYGVQDLAFSPDGKSLATGDGDGVVRLWDPVTGNSQKSFSSDSGSVFTVAFSLDGKRLAAGGDKGGVQLWDLASGGSQQSLDGHIGGVQGIAFSPDSMSLATGGGDNTVHLWDAATGRKRKTFTGHKDGVTSVSFSPDGKALATTSEDGTIRLWDPMTGRNRETLIGHSGYVSAVAFSPNGKTMVTGGGDSTVRLWDPIASVERNILVGHNGSVQHVSFGTDGKTLATADSDGTVRLWDPVTGRIRMTLTTDQGQPVYVVVYSPDGRTLAAGGNTDTVRLWDPGSGRSRKSLTGIRNGAAEMAFSSDGRTLATGADDAVQLWDPVTGRSRRSITTRDTVVALAFSPDGTTLATGGGDGGVQLWDPIAGTVRKTITAHSDSVAALAFGPDGKTLATGGYDGTVRMWDLVTGRSRKTIKAHDDSVLALAFSPDGKTLATGGGDGMARLWNHVTGRSRRTFTGHKDGVSAVSFSLDGRTLATSSYDGTVRLWDAALTNPTTMPGKICTAVGRDFTEAEWGEYRPGVAQGPVCRH